MFARAFIVALLVSSSTLAAQGTPASPPLDAAERALVDALSLPDADAFRELLAFDAVFSLPVQAQGPDAIVEKWRPFLSSREVTMAMIIESSTTAESGDMGETFGTLAVHGRTTKGMRTTPVGNISIVWRLVDGQWKIGELRHVRTRT